MATESSLSRPLATGSCLCASIRYTIRSPPLYTVLCHCRNCRKSSGGPFMTNAYYASSAINIIQSPSGTMKTYKDSDTINGATVERSFCGNCGSSLFARNEMRGEGWVVCSGSVDDDDGEGNEWADEVLRPMVELFCRDRRGWMEGRREVEKKDTI